MGLISDAAVSRGDLARRQTELEQETTEIRTARRSEQTSVTSGDFRIREGARLVITDDGDLVIQGGALRLQTSDGDSIIFFGDVLADDETSRGWVYRFDPESGSRVAFALQGDPGAQFWSLRDHAGNIIVSNDANTGAGLARPYIPMPLPKPVNITHWSSTDSATFTALDRSLASNQHPWIGVNFSAFADAGTTGDVRFTVNGTTVGDTVTVSDGNFDAAGFEAELPDGTGFNDGMTLELEARRTDGSGEVYGICRSVYGIQSS